MLPGDNSLPPMFPRHPAAHPLTSLWFHFRILTPMCRVLVLSLFPYQQLTSNSLGTSCVSSKSRQFWYWLPGVSVRWQSLYVHTAFSSDASHESHVASSCFWPAIYNQGAHEHSLVFDDVWKHSQNVESSVSPTDTLFQTIKLRSSQRRVVQAWMKSAKFPGRLWAEWSTLRKSRLRTRRPPN